MPLLLARAIADARLRLLYLIAQLIEALRYRTFARGHVLPIALPNPLRPELHAHLQLVLLHVAERLTQFAGCASLGTGEVANRALHISFEAVQFVQHALTLPRERFTLLCSFVPAATAAARPAGLQDMSAEAC